MKMKIDYSGIEKLRENLQKLSEEQVQQFTEAALKELAARLLAKVIRLTPVGDYRGDVYTTKTGKERHRNYKMVNFATKDGKKVSFKAKTSGKLGGTLRRGWTSQTHESAKHGTGSGSDSVSYANSLNVAKSGNEYTIEIINPVNYASYVEYGHRTRSGKGWVEGRRMLTISEDELQRDAPGILERKLKSFIGDVFK